MVPIGEAAKKCVQDYIESTRKSWVKQAAEEALSKGLPADGDAYLAMEAALRRSNLRLDVARRYRKSGRSPYSES